MMFGEFTIAAESIFYRSAHSFAFVNLKPVLNGHVLVSTKRLCKHLTDLTDEETADLFVVAKKVQKMLERAHVTTDVADVATEVADVATEVADVAKDAWSTSAKSSRDSVAASGMTLTGEHRSKFLASERFHNVTSSTVCVQDGKDAGQTVQHVHVHVLARREGDFGCSPDNLYQNLATHDNKIKQPPYTTDTKRKKIAVLPTAESSCTGSSKETCIVSLPALESGCFTATAEPESNSWKPTRWGPDVKTGTTPKEGPAVCLVDVYGSSAPRAAPRSQTILDARFCQQLDKIQQKLVEKKVGKSQCFIHQGNSLPLTALQTLAKISELNCSKIKQPPYTTDTASPDCHLLRSVDHFLHGRRIAEVDEVSAVVHDFCRSKPAEFYRDVVHSVYEERKKLVENNGNYFV
ncbi:unnamed protein product [Heligmosomoides polygyrus]|uniref:HIT domain-containing protein n=1 Tax=Heligmosomoides polygyrus TaxID=6339 RepID=A0A3P7WMK2_HELPZ|nr:unnamed protein product [Heligmosomoides polygyrus]